MNIYLLIALCIVATGLVWIISYAILSLSKILSSVIALGVTMLTSLVVAIGEGLGEPRSISMHDPKMKWVLFLVWLTVFFISLVGYLISRIAPRTSNASAEIALPSSDQRYYYAPSSGQPRQAEMPLWQRIGLVIAFHLGMHALSIGTFTALSKTFAIVKNFWRKK